MDKFENHTFVICAYKESEYLEECVKSLINQTVKSNILLATSTPNEYISNIANKYNLSVCVNEGKKGIGPDWNFAVSQAKTDYVTIAHQDDVYANTYTEEMKKAIDKNPDAVMLFTNHKEIRDGEVVKMNVNLKIKWIMLLPFRIFKRSRFIKRLVFSFGNPISCPSVTMNTKIVGSRPYREDMNSNIDWGTWVDWIEKKGSFIYVTPYLTFHRVHGKSETSNCINSNKRVEEDYQMFCRFWPKPIAKFIMIFYKNAVKAN